MVHTKNDEDSQKDTFLGDKTFVAHSEREGGGGTPRYRIGGGK